MNPNFFPQSHQSFSGYQGNPVDILARIQRLSKELPILEDECETIFGAKQERDYLFFILLAAPVFSDESFAVSCCRTWWTPRTVFY